MPWELAPQKATPPAPSLFSARQFSLRLFASAENISRQEYILPPRLRSAAGRFPSENTGAGDFFLAKNETQCAHRHVHTKSGGKLTFRAAKSIDGVFRDFH
jgi:hypothetical protein